MPLLFLSELNRCVLAVILVYHLPLSKHYTFSANWTQHPSSRSFRGRDLVAVLINNGKLNKQILILFTKIQL